MTHTPTNLNTFNKLLLVADRFPVSFMMDGLILISEQINTYWCIQSREKSINKRSQNLASKSNPPPNKLSPFHTGSIAVNDKIKSYLVHNHLLRRVKSILGKTHGAEASQKRGSR